MKYRGLFLLLALALSACGSGGGGGSGGGTTAGGTTGGTGGTTGGGATPTNPSFQFDTGIGGSGGVIGDIDAFGSIFINGLELETDDTEIYIEGSSGFSQNDLREGYYVVVAGDITNSDADEVFYRANLKGPVSAAPVVVDALTGHYEVTVLGQTVVTSASTRFSNVLAANIVQGDLLEVSGPLDSEGRVLATFVERKTSLAEYKAIGNVSNLDTNAETFDLGGLAVTYTGAAFSDFDGASLANGQLVEVKMAPGAFDSATASATVTEVELLPVPSIEEGAEVEVEGYIDSFTSQTQFTVSGIPVTTDTGTIYEDGNTGLLGPNVKVEVEGTANASGVIVAERIEFKSDNAIRVEGRIIEVDVAAGTVSTALGIVYSVRASTEMEDDRSGGLQNLTINDLMIGDYIEVRGFLERSTVVAVELEREDDPSSERALLRGPFVSADKAAGTVVIHTVTVSDDGATQYEDETESNVDRDTFYDVLLPTARQVKADWDNFGDLSTPADTLSLEDDD